MDKEEKGIKWRLKELKRKIKQRSYKKYDKREKERMEEDLKDPLKKIEHDIFSINLDIKSFEDYLKRPHPPESESEELMSKLIANFKLRKEQLEQEKERLEKERGSA